MYVHKSSSTKMTKQQDQLKRSWLRCIELSCLNLLLLLWQWKESRINGSKFIDVMMQYGTYNFRVLGIWKVTQKTQKSPKFQSVLLGTSLWPACIVDIINLHHLHMYIAILTYQLDPNLFHQVSVVSPVKNTKICSSIRHKSTRVENWATIQEHIMFITLMHNTITCITQEHIVFSDPVHVCRKMRTHWRSNTKCIAYIRTYCNVMICFEWTQLHQFLFAMQQTCLLFRTHTYLYKIPKTRENEKDFVRGDVFQQLSAVAEWCGNEMPLRWHSKARIYTHDPSAARTLATLAKI